ncbi:response regulator [Rhodoferax lacus]|nr:response regulator [Rhodoferax lacus]
MTLDGSAATLRRNLLLGFVAVNVLVGIWFFNALSLSRAGYESNAVATTQNMALLLDQSVSGSVNSINVTLLSTQDFMEERLREHRSLSVTEVNAYFKRAQARLPDLYGIRAANAEGAVVFGTDVDPKAQASWADRDFFAALKNDPGRGLVVTNPIYGKVTKKWILSFVRRYNHPDGRFAGVISASMPVEYFYGLLASLNVGPSGIALLRDSNLALIARYPAIIGANGQLGAKTFSPELNAAIQSGRQSVTFHTKRTSDNVERTSTYRRLSQVPFHLVTGLASDDYLAAWRTEAENAVIQYAIFLLVTALATWLLYQSYQRMRMAQQRSAAVLRGASDGIHVLDQEGKLVFANDSFFRMLGREYAADVTLGVEDWDHSLSKEQLLGLLSESLQSGKQKLVQTVHRRLDGSTFNVEVSILPQELQGRMVLFCASRDVSDRFKAEAEARQTQALMIAAIDAAGEAFVMYDEDDRLVYCNAKYHELYASTRDWIVVGTRFEDLVRWGAQRGIYKDAVGHEEAFVAERVAAHQAGNVEVVTHLEDGRSIRVLDRKMPNGYTVGFRLDITGLVQATQRAEEAARSKAQFLANMSHEIRTPMNAILGLLNLLQSTELTSRQRDYASKTEGAAQSLLGLLNDILDFSKAEAGKMTLEDEPFRLDKVLRNLSVVLSSNVGAKDIEVLYDLDASLPTLVRGDAMRLHQVLVNLCGNAIKFTAEGEVVLSLHMLAQDRHSATIEFAVKDTGIGIAPALQSHIFSGFSQAEGSTTRRFGGTGLGLAISKRLVEMMGGRIDIHSTPGTGSTFSFVLKLPVVERVPEALAEPNRTVPAPQRVLVVDDHSLGSALTLRMVRSWGWPADLASSGPLALDMVASAFAANPLAFPYPVIYMDWQMPDMDGWEATHHIRQWARERGLAQPTIIMVTAHGRDVLTHRTAAEQDLLNGFLVKPVTAAALLDALIDAGTGDAGLRHMTTGRNNIRRLSGMRILVVEDNLINQQVADELLSAAGAIVSLAANGQLGVEAVAAAAPQFDVVLMDVQMPVLDGYGATRAIREELGLAQLPIIAMTANALATDREACLAAGMNAHVGKPFDIGELVSLLVRICGFQSPNDLRDATPSAPAATDTLPEVTGLDLQGALGRMAGMRSLYVRTARDFVRIMDTVIQEIGQYLASGDRPAALMRLHTLKGNAGTLGATQLAQQAVVLEATCKAASATSDCVLGLEALGTQVRSTQASLHEAIALLEPDGPSPKASASDSTLPQAARQALQQISALAAADDFEVLQCFAESRLALSALPDDFVDTLEAALQDLDLQAVCVLCDDRLALA